MSLWGGSVAHVKNSKTNELGYTWRASQETGLLEQSSCWKIERWDESPGVFKARQG